ncbi:hypothetical protein E4U57_007161 [Claviceps arundinis]|uniref:PH domain-containing protein n=1 Tax=Claviceps arundinis TaxID=1623583 RepID=A0ABQ7PMD9_9HYPO|nr:hypothetical protein E4U57_007161 [Claviceps arundinis]
MASSMVPENRPDFPVSGNRDDANDPFVTQPSGSAHHRFSTFDQELFAAGPGSSPTQARRALEAHLAETDRRLDEAGKLGTALVSQRKLLAEQLQQVQKLQAEGELGPDLRKKLAEIEREYNDLSRESARVFLPKQRVPSNEAHQGSPFAIESRSRRRSVSPSKFESQATGSPTKLNVPNRKKRNQPSNRVHDIEFAAEISTSLIAQVRNLQALLSERDEELKTTHSEKQRLEIESESFQQRLKTLDESENRYKEENWNLETRLQESAMQQREAADREKKLTQALNIASAEKTAVQKELDDARLSHSKLAEEHAVAVKHLDIELGTAKRNMVMAESERAAMQRKIDDLASQNQELALAFSSQRARAAERDSMGGLSEEDFETAADDITPEHSPPMSPIKSTPRHAMLETETIKSSLNHAQRTIQTQRSQLHREKTEKLELRKIIQDLRDDLEKSRSEVSTASGGAFISRRSRKAESKESKKPARLLGSIRPSRQEVLLDDDDDDDDEWEDHVADSSPSRSSVAGANPFTRTYHPAESNDHFDTANEASESAFETANERATETDDFQTGNERLSDSEDDDETETESLSRGFGHMKRQPGRPAVLSRPGTRDSFHSTASTSADEEDPPILRTPTGTLSSQRSRFRLSRSRGGFSRRSRQSSQEPNMRDSPASHTSGGTPKAAGQSLFAELQDFGSDDESLAAATPSRRSIRSGTPGSVRRILTPPPPLPFMARAVMVDSGVMTEPVKITTEAFEEDSERPVSMESVVHAGDDLPATWSESRAIETDFVRAVPTSSYSDASIQYEPDIDMKIAGFSAAQASTHQVRPPTPPSLALSPIRSQHVEPREEPVVVPAPPTLRLSPLAVECVEPRLEAEIPAPPLSLSAIAAEALEPVMEPVTPRAQLSITPVMVEAIEPVSILQPVLSLSTMFAEALEPVAELVSVPAIAVAPIPVQAYVQPEVVTPPALSMSSIVAAAIEPREETVLLPIPSTLQLSGLSTQSVEPIPDPVLALPPLALSSIATQHTQPSMEPMSSPPALSLSSIAAEDVEPVEPAVSPRVALALSNFGFSTIESVECRPMSPRSPRRDAFILPRDDASVPPTPTDRLFGSVLSRGRKRDIEPIIAEDETRLSTPDSPNDGTPESQLPFKEISTNTDARSSRKQGYSMNDQAAQTSLTSGAIDQLLKTGSQRSYSHFKTPSFSSVGTPETTGTVRIYRSQESFDSPLRLRGRHMGDAVLDTIVARPGSAASGRGSGVEASLSHPNHRPTIETVQSESSHGQGQNSMGPPLRPASATKARPQTPRQQASLISDRGARPGSVHHGTAEIHPSGRITMLSRHSSVTSFASEIDTRFNMRAGDMGMNPTGFGPNTDPRMIQAITQTMIGEFLWKYTRKTGRGEMSEKRHRRYFWVHPYTRTLYWSDSDPSAAGKSELKAKSVPIEAVRVVTDDNPMPPGLHRKSLVIISPGRAIKFTCTTGQRHETWFNALSYLLLRTGHEPQADAEEVAVHITQDDADDCNLQTSRASGHDSRPRPPPSLSSYHSRTTRNESPALDMSMNIPTLTVTPSAKHQQGGAAGRSSTGTFSKLSGYWRSGAPKLSETLSNFRGRGASAQSWNIYEASEVHDSAEDLRELIERQDRESDRLENVRACCDGKHDVGSLPHTGRRGRGPPSHSHPGPSNASTTLSSMRPKA